MTVTVEILVPGPQGPAGPQGATGPAGGVSNLYELQDVNVTGKTDKSILRFDSSSNKWIGDSVDTITSLTDGGNF